MVAGTAPIYTDTPKTSWINVVTANTSKDLTSGTTYLLMTAGADGSFVKAIRLRPAGTNVATVIRIWITNATGPGALADVSLYDEITVAATSNVENAAIAGTEVPMNIVLQAGYKIYLTTGTTVTSIFATCIYGDY